MDDIDELMAGLDHPRPLPSRARAAIGGALVAAASAPAAGPHPAELPHPDHRQPTVEDQAALSFIALDTPVTIPSAARARIESALTAQLGVAAGAAPTRPVFRLAQRWVQVAAAVVLAGGVLSAVVQAGSHDNEHVAARPAPPGNSSGLGRSLASGGSAGTGSSSSSAGAFASGAAGPGAMGSGAGGTAAGPAGGAMGGTPAAGPEGAALTGPPPPYAFPGGPTPSPAAQTEAGSRLGALRIAVIRGDPQQEAGFNAYITLLNNQGGIRGRPVQAVPISPTAPADAAAIATVNLSPAAVAGASGAPAWTATPLLETLAVPDAALSGAVFDLASTPTHQARLAAAAVFPTTTPGRTAVIYRAAAGIFAADVPNALASALQARGVAAVIVTYTPGGPFATPPGDAAFVSLDRSEAQAWFAAATRAGYHPKLGVTGVFSLGEPSLAGVMPDGTRVLAPYDLPSTTERAALAAALGSQPGMSAVQGWVTAKALAVALWESDATTPAATTSALRNLAGYDDGWSPAFSFRAGTTSRTPDADILTVSHGLLSGDGRFSTDPHP